MLFPALRVTHHSSFCCTSRLKKYPDGVGEDAEDSAADIHSLAYAELYLTLAHLFRRFDLELYQTTPEDMEWKDVTVPRMRGHLKLLVREAKD